MKKIPVLLLFFLISFFVLAVPASAADDPNLTDLGSDQINLHPWTGIVGLDIVSGLSCQIGGWDPAKPDGSGCVVYGTQGKLQVMKKPSGGAVAFTGNLIAVMSASPPASGVQYLADLGQNLGIIKPAYAQEGVGFRSLTPLLGIWKVFRNIAYFLFVLVFIGIGFAIMFRVKISPQAVVTIQSAIPRIVIALILVTFSYAIVGFMLDLMYVLVFLIFSLFREALLFNYPGLNDAIKGLDSQGGLTLPLQVLFTLASYVFAVLPRLVIIFAPAPILALIVLVIVLYTQIRILFSVLLAYVGIILSLFFGPLQIALGALPGNGSIGAWFRNLLANVAVLPTIWIMIMLAGFFLSYGPLPTPTDVGNDLNQWMNILRQLNPINAFTGGGFNPVAGSIQGFWNILSFITMPLLGFGIFLLTPKAAQMVKDTLKVTPFKYGTAFGEAMRPVSGPLRYGWRSAKTVGGDVAQGYIGSKLPEPLRKYTRQGAGAGTPALPGGGEKGLPED